MALPRRSLAAGLAGLVAVALLGGAVVAEAHAPHKTTRRPEPRPRPWPRPEPRPVRPAPAPVNVRVTLEDASGNALRSFSHSSGTWVQGEEGARYVIRLHNESAQRVEVVVSVDGRDVVSGRPASFRRDRGYLVRPHSSVVIEGFRQSLDAVAAFRFVPPSESYSARRGTPENVGVIGVAVFPERAPVEVARRRWDDEGDARPRKKHNRAHPAPTTDSEARAPSAPRGGAGAAPRTRSAEADSPRDEAEQRLGTEYGESHESRVEEVPFERANPSRPARLVTLRYDSLEGLRERGILPVERRRSRRSPEAWPESRFAPPP